MSSIFRSFKYSIITLITQFVTGSLIYIVLARYLNLNDFGIIAFGTTFSGLVAVIAEYGFSLMLQKDIPQNKYEYGVYITNVLCVKVVISIVVCIISLIYLRILFFHIFLFGVLFLVNAIITSFVVFFLSLSRSKMQFDIETKSSILYAFVLIVLFILYFILNLQLILISVFFLLPRIFQLLYLIVKLSVNSSFSFNKINYSFQTYIFKRSTSFGLHYIIGIFYFSIDSQMVSYYAGNEALALYQAVFKLVFLFLMIGDVVTNVLFPFLSSNYFFKYKLSVYSKLFNSFLFYLGLLFFLFFNCFGGLLLNIIYSDKYDSASSVIFPLSFVLLLRIWSSVLSIMLTISNKQHIRVFVVLISLLFNSLMNFLFIPKYGFVGAAYVSMFTHMVLFVLYFAFSKNTVDLIGFKKNIGYLVIIFSFVFLIDEFNSYFKIIIYLFLLIFTYYYCGVKNVKRLIFVLTK